MNSKTTQTSRQALASSSSSSSDSDCDVSESELEGFTLNRKKHIEELIIGLTNKLSHNFEKLVPGQTWLVYWITHSLSLLEQSHVVTKVKDDIIEFMRECVDPEGGYGGGPGQIAHLATTYAAINSLITTSSEEALDSIDRPKLIKFMHRMKQPDGSFTMHDDGEIDSRATYCALAVLKCLNISDSVLTENVTEWILRCQTYEGGFGSVPGSEAHGGYTFCCVASLCLLNQLERLNMPALLRWLTNKQLPCQGGFCGRSNKLIDSCYSYWQGAVFPLIQPFLKRQMRVKPNDSESNASEKSMDDITGSSDLLDPGPSTQERRTSKRISAQKLRKGYRNTDNSHSGGPCDKWIFSYEAIQGYILGRCQSKNGLLRDKPGTSADFYHTCYALSGLSISQHQPDGSTFDLGAQDINCLAQTNALFNLNLKSLDFCLSYYRGKKIDIISGQDSELKDKNE